MERKDLIDYISKLNERNLKRQSASGFTLWAIVGVIVYLSNKIINNIFEIQKLDYPFFLFIQILALVLNYGFSVSIVLIGLAYIATTEKRRLTKPNLEMSSSLFIVISFFFLYISFSLINFYAAASTLQKAGTWIFLSFSLFYIYNFPIYIAYKKFKYFFMKRRGIFYHPEIEDFNPWEKRQFTLVGIIFIIIAVIILVANYIVNSKISLPSDYDYVKLIFKTSIEIFLFFILIILLAFQIKAITKHSWLELLERDIYLNELSTDEIMDRLETEYIGSSVDKWIQRQREKCNEAFTNLIRELNDFNAKIEGLQTQSQLEANKKALYSEYSKKVGSYKQIYNNYFSKLKALLSSGLTQEEIDEWKIFIEELSLSDKKTIKVFKEIKGKLS